MILVHISQATPMKLLCLPMVPAPINLSLQNRHFLISSDAELSLHYEYPSRMTPASFLIGKKASIAGFPTCIGFPSSILSNM
jgi:hypothetical protein